MLIYLQLGHFLDYLSITNATCTLIHENQKDQNNENYYKAYIQQQHQQQPSLIPLCGVGYMDQITP